MPRQKNYNRAMTQEEVAEKFGVTRSCISKIESRAMRKIRAAIEVEANEKRVTIREVLFGDGSDSREQRLTRRLRDDVLNSVL